MADLVEKIALSHPDISVRFIQNNQNKLYTSGNHNLKDLIYTIYGREVAANLLETEGREGEIQVRGFIGKPLIGRGNRNYENYFINGRYIKSNIIAKAIEDAYKPYLMQHKYPFTLLHFTIDQDVIDVNVHPTKMELRFKDGDLVYRVVYDAVSQALAHRELIPQVSLKEEKKQEKKKEDSIRQPHPEPFEYRRRQVLEQSLNKVAHKEEPVLLREKTEAAVYGQKETREENKKTVSEAVSMPESKPEPRPVPDPEPKQTAPVRKEPAAQMDLFESKFLDPASRKRHRLIGQVFDTYWMVEYDNQLFIIDQHAAHEKILYEKTMESLKKRDFETQMISPPLILTLNTNEALLLNQYMDAFTHLGFEIEPFGGNEFAVRGVPSNLLSIANRELLMEMIDSLTEEGLSGQPDLICEKVASMSCKAAVKGNHAMSAAEADAMIDQLLKLENPYHCPHGRPVMVSMSKYEMEKKFKRIV